MIKVWTRIMLCKFLMRNLVSVLPAITMAIVIVNISSILGRPDLHMFLDGGRWRIKGPEDLTIGNAECREDAVMSALLFFEKECKKKDGRIR